MRQYIVSPFIHALHHSGSDVSFKEPLRRLSEAVAEVEKYRDYGVRNQGAYRVVVSRKVCMWWRDVASHHKEVEEGAVAEQIDKLINCIDAIQAMMCGLPGNTPYIASTGVAAAEWIPDLGGSFMSAMLMLQSYSDIYSGHLSEVGRVTGRYFGPAQYESMALATCLVSTVRQTAARTPEIDNADCEKFGLELMCKIGEPTCDKGNGYCYKAAYLFEEAPDLGPWPYACAIFATTGWNYFTPVRRVSESTWHVAVGGRADSVLGLVPRDQIVGGLVAPAATKVVPSPAGMRTKMDVTAEVFVKTMAAGKFRVHPAMVVAEEPLFDIVDAHAGNEIDLGRGVSLRPLFVGNEGMAFAAKCSVDLDCSVFGEGVRVFVPSFVGMTVNGYEPGPTIVELPISNGRCVANLQTICFRGAPLIVVSGLAPRSELGADTSFPAVASAQGVPRCKL